MDLLKHSLFSFLIIVTAICSSSAQTFESHRITDWQNAGLTDEFEEPEQTVSILDFGGDNTGGSSNNTALATAINSIATEGGTVFFPEGTYLFNSGINIPSNIFLEGESAETTLRFDLGGTGNAVVMNGNLSNQTHALASNAVKGTHTVELTDASDFEAGDIIRLGMSDEDLMYSSWAYGTLGQVVKITAIENDVLELADPLNHHYPLSRSPFVRAVTPIQNAGLSCLKIERIDETASQTSNVWIRSGYNILLKNIESIDCNFSHVEVNSSCHVQIEGGYFHHAHAYGGGGQGYGVVFQEASSFNLAQNNSFEHLRHSMLMQSGANGNVYAYNYSYDPYWVSGFLPANSAGDAVLHGNYTYLNLFEGNVVQNVVVDASHGSNGPYNTFFRNRGELYGFFSDSGTPTDSMNVVGTEITNSGFPYGMFAVNGSGHYNYGNNVYGTATPTGTENLTLKSLFLEPQESTPFLEYEDLPLVGYPRSMNDETVAAQIRFESQTPVSCSEVITDIIESDTEPFFEFKANQIVISEDELPCSFELYNSVGALIDQGTFVNSVNVLTDRYSSGIAFIRLTGKRKRAMTSALYIP